jgi:hypothetical protein
MLALVVCTLVFSAALPVREFLSQRSEISAVEQQQSQTRARVAALEEAKRQLQDPAFVTAEARRRLHLAKPGEVTYVVLPPPAPPAPPPGPQQQHPSGTTDSPWWSQLWGSVSAADQARPPAR